MDGNIQHVDVIRRTMGVPRGCVLKVDYSVDNHNVLFKVASVIS